MLDINKTYSIIKGKEDPLSSDCAIITINNHLYVFDVGTSKEIVDELNNINKDKTIIISHFHLDHIGNLSKINYQKLYISKNTYKYTKTGEIVKDKIVLDNKIEIFEIICSHCKGSLGLKVGSYAFIGDCLAPQIKKDVNVYNVQLLKQEIEQFKKLDVKYFVDSHNMEKIMSKEDVLIKLENIYGKRQKDNPYITI